MLAALFITCEAGLRIRLAYLYKNPVWFFYHQFKLRAKSQIDADMPHYYKDNMFKPFKLVFKQAPAKDKKEIITVESSALRSIRRQLEKIVEGDPDFAWLDYSPDNDKRIEFTNNSIVLYEFLVYPDIYNTLKRENRLLSRIFGPTLDDLLYHNFVFYMHLDENIIFSTMDDEGGVRKYIGLLLSREEPFCRDIANMGLKNVFYVITPNRFDSDSPGGRIYLKYVHAAYNALIPLLNKYGVPFIDLMRADAYADDFKDFFHFSPQGGRKFSYKILEYLRNARNLHAF